MTVPEFPCHDCGVNTIPLEGDREYYEVHDELWHAAGAPGIGQSDNGPHGFFLCIGCLEARLSRLLTPEDFKDIPANKRSPWLSLRLNSRLGGYFTSLNRAVVAQRYPNALHDAVMARFKPDQVHREDVGSAAFGINE